MSSDNNVFDFSTLIDVKKMSGGKTFYSNNSDENKRQIAVVSALQLINSSLLAGHAGLGEVEDMLPEVTQAILNTLNGVNPPAKESIDLDDIYGNLRN